MTLITIPFILTAFRLFGSLFLLPPFFIWYLPFNSLVYNTACVCLFVCIGATDFFDGYFARKYGQETLLGKLFDPLADKVFVMTTLVTLLAVGKIGLYWVIVLLAREFFVMGLRELALHKGFSVSVGYSGKCKTAVQMLSLACIIINPYQALGFVALWWNGIELFLLGSSVVLSLLSATFYFRDFLNRV